jgi:catechol 2,3-dioxygenase-like lactoylglutathione lyase family enzyme
MTAIAGIDHIYITVSDMERSERFYDVAMRALAFRKNTFTISGDRHVQYYNRHFGYVLRPAKSATIHDRYSPGLHHLCFRVESEADVVSARVALRTAGVETTEPRRYPEYAPDYFATFFFDPDGIRLEITNYREERRDRHDHWDKIES